MRSQNNTTQHTMQHVSLLFQTFFLTLCGLLQKKEKKRKKNTWKRLMQQPDESQVKCTCNSLQTLRNTAFTNLKRYRRHHRTLNWLVNTYATTPWKPLNTQEHSLTNLRDTGAITEHQVNVCTILFTSCLLVKRKKKAHGNSYTATPWKTQTFQNTALVILETQ